MHKHIHVPVHEHIEQNEQTDTSLAEQRILPYCARKPETEAPAQRWSPLLY